MDDMEGAGRSVFEDMHDAFSFSISHHRAVIYNWCPP